MPRTQGPPCCANPQALRRDSGSASGDRQHPDAPWPRGSQCSPLDSQATYNDGSHRARKCHQNWGFGVSLSGSAGFLPSVSTCPEMSPLTMRTARRSIYQEHSPAGVPSMCNAPVPTPSSTLHGAALWRERRRRGLCWGRGFCSIVCMPPSAL